MRVTHLSPARTALDLCATRHPDSIGDLLALADLFATLDNDDSMGGDAA